MSGKNESAFFSRSFLFALPIRSEINIDEPKKNEI
jgi:hypothetical protein